MRSGSLQTAIRSAKQSTEDDPMGTGVVDHGPMGTGVMGHFEGSTAVVGHFERGKGDDE